MSVNTGLDRTTSDFDACEHKKDDGTFILEPTLHREPMRGRTTCEPYERTIKCPCLVGQELQTNVSNIRTNVHTTIHEKIFQRNKYTGQYTLDVERSPKKHTFHSVHQLLKWK